MPCCDECRAVHVPGCAGLCRAPCCAVGARARGPVCRAGTLVPCWAPCGAVCRAGSRAVLGAVPWAPCRAGHRAVGPVSWTVCRAGRRAMACRMPWRAPCHGMLCAVPCCVLYHAVCCAVLYSRHILCAWVCFWHHYAGTSRAILCTWVRGAVGLSLKILGMRSMFLAPLCWYHQSYSVHMGQGCGGIIPQNFRHAINVSGTTMLVPAELFCAHGSGVRWDYPSKF